MERDYGWRKIRSRQRFGLSSNGQRPRLFHFGRWIPQYQRVCGKGRRSGPFGHERGLISARVVKVDAANDLALLKAEGRFAALPVAASRAVKLGGTVATVGFPNIGLQGF